MRVLPASRRRVSPRRPRTAGHTLQLVVGHVQVVEVAQAAEEPLVQVPSPRPQPQRPSLAVSRMPGSRAGRPLWLRSSSRRGRRSGGSARNSLALQLELQKVVERAKGARLDVADAVLAQVEALKAAQAAEGLVGDFRSLLAVRSRLLRLASGWKTPPGSWRFDSCDRSRSCSPGRPAKLPAFRMRGDAVLKDVQAHGTGGTSRGTVVP